MKASIRLLALMKSVPADLVNQFDNDTETCKLTCTKYGTTESIPEIYQRQFVNHRATVAMRHISRELFDIKCQRRVAQQKGSGHYPKQYRKFMDWFSHWLPQLFQYFWTRTHKSVNLGLQDTWYGMSLSDRDIIRKRPGMYIGDTGDGSGLHNMIYEVVQNAINESFAGFGQRIDVILSADGSCTVRDNGRGIPVDIHPTERIPAAELVLTKLASVRYHLDIANDSKQMHSVGVAVVNALSEHLELRIWRGGEEYLLRFREGLREAPLANVGRANKRRGTEIMFIPCSSIFAETNFSFAVLENHFRGRVRSKADITLVLTDERGQQKKEAIIAI